MSRRLKQTYDRTPRKQTGVVLFIALIVLVAMTLAGIALVRSVDTGNVVAGNIAFRQAAVQEADLGIDAALASLATTPLTSNSGVYYATRQPLATNGVPAALNSMKPNDAIGAGDVYPANGGYGPAGNRVRFLIERMCDMVPGVGAGSPTPPATAADVKTYCITYSPTGEVGGSQNALNINLGAVAADNVYYRASIRVDGPRNTVSMIQAMLRF